MLLIIALALGLCFVSNIVCEERQGSSEKETCRPTTPDILGPYYFPDPPYRRQICDHDPAFASVQHVLVEGRILDENCRPVIDAKIEVWQADHEGHYLFKANCRGYFFSKKGGHYAFLTLHPGKYTTDPTGELYRPAHVHFKVGKPGVDTLVTQMYFEGDPSLGKNDSCERCSSDHKDLIVEPEVMCADDSGLYCFHMAHFDIVLKQGSEVDVVQDVDDSLVELIDIVEAGK